MQWAQYNLAIMYRDGDGVSKDQEAAVKWLKKAAQQGDEDAKAQLKRLGH